jgi:hypothetical protein
MRKLMTSAIAIALLAGPVFCFADASYEHTSQITGGQLVSMVKSLAFLSKQMRQITEPTSEITMVHGNQKAIVSKTYTEIWDLDKEQIIHIDNTQKSYSIMTFADMRKALAEMPAKMAQMQEQMKEQQAKMQQAQNQAPAIPPNLQFNTTVDVKDTGLTKMVDKYNARQQILTMKLIVTDTNNPTTNVTYSFTDEIWTTPEVPSEMKDVQEFDKRFGEKMMQGVDTKDLLSSMQNMRNNSGMMMAQLFGSKPGAADAFAHMGKELAKIKGTRLIEITRMGGSGTGIDQSGANGAQAQAPNGSSVAGQVATNTAQNTTSATASSATSHVGGIGGAALSSAVGGALSGVFGHKKKADNPPPAAATPAATPGTVTTTDVTLMEMTTNTHDFSGESVPSSVFQIPGGYKQVESPMEQMMNKK